jgi:hypothetical protein
MNTSALILMLSVQIAVTAITIWLYIKMVVSGKKKSDS